MPYNFKLNFEDALLAKLDSGHLNGADQWAEAIVSCYDKTIRAGSPVGIPPVLPAPGLNPTAPPPFTIGPTGYAPTKQRLDAMHRIIKTFFEAKELSIHKAHIQQLGRDLKDLSRKFRQAKSRVQALMQESALIKEEVRNLDVGLREVWEDLSADITSVKVDLANLLVKSQSDSGLDPEAFRQLYGKELSLVESILSLDVSDPANVLKVVETFSVFGLRQDFTLKSLSTEGEIRATLTGKVQQVVSLVSTYANAYIHPENLISVVKTASKYRVVAERVWQRVNQVDFIVRTLRPRFIRIQRKINEIKDQVLRRVKQRMVDLQKDIKVKVQAFLSKKGDSKFGTVFKHIGKLNSQDQKVNRDRMHKHLQEVKSLRGKIAATYNIGARVVAVVVGLDQELKGLDSSISDDLVPIGESVQLQLRSATREEVMHYLTVGGFGELSARITDIFVGVGLPLSRLKEFLERKSDIARQYGEQIAEIIADLRVLLGLGPSSETANSRKSTLKSVYSRLVLEVSPLINKALTQLHGSIDRITTRAKSASVRLMSGLKERTSKIKVLPSRLQQPVDKYLHKGGDKANIADTAAASKKVAQLAADAGRILKTARSISKAIQSSPGDFSATHDALLGITQLVPSKHRPQIQDAANRIVLIQALIKALVDYRVRVDQEKSEGGLGLDQYEYILHPPTDIIGLQKYLNQVTLDVVQVGAKVRNLKVMEDKFRGKLDSIIQTLRDVCGPRFTSQLERGQTVLLSIVSLIDQHIKAIVVFLKKVVLDLVRRVVGRLSAKKQSLIERRKRQVRERKQRKFNDQGIAMGLAFKLAANVLWVGASWTGPTGSNHTALRLGPARRIKGTVEGGPTEMITEISRLFQDQLLSLQGIVTPPANTGIPPIPFVGYK